MQMQAVVKLSDWLRSEEMEHILKTQDTSLLLIWNFGQVLVVLSFFLRWGGKVREELHLIVDHHLVQSA